MKGYIFISTASFNKSVKKHSRCLVLLIFIPFQIIRAGLTQDTINRDQGWNFHFQNTVIVQNHPAFHADYSGKNSLKSEKETTTSISSTFFLGMKLWKGADLYFNPELSGGNGFSQTLGVAGFPNGEVYRISDPAPHIYLARLYLKQIFSLDNEYIFVPDAANQIARKMPASYLAISAGRFSVLDFYDNNSYSHDPRSQFFNWALMGNGSWDYPADTRGYTYGINLEIVRPESAIRLAAVMMPKEANGSVMDPDIHNAHAFALEFEKKYTIGSNNGIIRVVTFLNKARMGSYKNAINWGIAHNLPPQIDSVNQTGNTKVGIGINIEHRLTKYAGLFLRAGWNDGHNETWVFTEIDRSVSAGISLDGDLWNRKDDIIGIAQIINGISKDHQNYLGDGGYGFIIGDGKLNYAAEFITEAYYSFRLSKYNFWICPDYQFIVNPAYNKDRGAVHVFGIRLHAEI